MRPFLFRFPEFLGRIPDWVPLVGGTQVGGRPVFSYGMMLAIAIVSGWLLAQILDERMGSGKRRLNLLLAWGLLGSILGARLLYFAASAPDQLTLERFLQFSEGGLVAYGGFLGGLSASAIAAQFLKVDWWNAADSTAPSMLLGTGITRIGCYSFGCDFGMDMSGPLAVRFPQWDVPAVLQWVHGNAPAFAQHFPSNPTALTPVLSNPVLPAQLIMALNGIIGFALLMWLLPRRRFSGQIMLGFLIYYATTRFFIEMIRGDTIRGTTTLGLPVSTSQFVSLAVLAVAPVLWWVLSRRSRAATKKL